MKRLTLIFSITSALLAPLAHAQHISVGVVGGVPFSGGLSDFTSHGVDTVAHTFSNSNDFLVGPMIDIRLPLSLGIEADALYRPINVTTDFQVVPNPAIRTSRNPATWEFPILGKYRLPFLPVVKPFVEAGPSFRARSSSVSFLSSKGFTMGAGIEVKILRVRIAPALRYTHWGSGAPGNAAILLSGAGTTVVTSSGNPSNQDQGEFLIGFSF
jgi:hypothetical protein